MASENKEVAGSGERQAADVNAPAQGGEMLLRNHITYIVEKAWAVLLVFFISFISNEELQKAALSVMKGEKLDGELWLEILGIMIVLLLFVLIAGWYLIRWYRITLSVKEGTITYNQRTLVNKKNTLSVQQISNVNIEQNIFEMIFGTCKMRLDTDSLSTAESTDIEMILKKKKAEQVKSAILKMKEGVEETDGKEMAAEQEEYDIIYSAKDMILNGILSISVLQLVIAVCFIFSFMITLNVILEDVKQGDFDGVGSGLVVLLTEFVTAYSLVWAIVKKILMDFRFRAKRKNNQIYVSCGLWKKKSYMVPVSKINAVKIEYPVIARVFRRGCLRVLNVGGEGEEVDGMKLLLLGTYEELRQKMEILLPEYELPDLRKRTRAPRQWLYCRGIFSVLTGGICGAAVYLGMLFASEASKEIQGLEYLFCIGAALAVMILRMAISFLAYKTYALGYMERDFLLIHGIFKKEISLIPYERIQYICYTQGPLERTLGLQHGYVSLLASAVSRFRQMGCFHLEDFEMLEEKLRETY